MPWIAAEARRRSGRFEATVSALSPLLERLRLSKAPFLASVALLLAAGALEGVPIALLVPLSIR